MDERTQIQVHTDTIKLFPFQGVEDIEFKDIC